MLMRSRTPECCICSLTRIRPQVISPDNSYSAFVKWPTAQLDYVTKVAAATAADTGSEQVSSPFFV